MSQELDTKICAVCDEEKPLTEYYPCKPRHGAGSLRQECKSYGAKRNKLWRESNKEKVAGYHRKHNALARESGKRRDWFLRRTYGITLEGQEELKRTQSGKCAICGYSLDESMHVDHDHATGRVRGLLCCNCNQGLGQFKDNLSLLRKAVEYLETKGGE